LPEDLFEKPRKATKKRVITKAIGKKSYKKSHATKGKYLSLKKFSTKRQYYLTNHYWPHWHNYYTNFSYYPYYNFYWFFYDHYHTHHHQYYSYFFHHHPHIHHYHVSNRVYFTHGHPVIIASASLASVKKYNIIKCDKGPKHILTVHHKGKHYRIFMGDVNDFTNLGCLYFMDSVVSVGKTAFVDRVKKLFVSKKKTIEVKGKSIDVSPFKKNPFSPSGTKVKKVSKNAKILKFSLKNKKSGKKTSKSLLFYHLFNKQIRKDSDAKKIFTGLRKNTSKSTSNVLFIADHLEPKSLYILKYLLTAYKKLSLKTIVKLTYRRIRIFSGIYLHHHHHLHHHH